MIPEGVTGFRKRSCFNNKRAHLGSIREPSLRREGDSRKMQTARRMNSKQMEIVSPSLMPDLGKTAFLLDIDGTIVDIAPTPPQVRVPHSLRRSLSRLNRRTG